MAIQVLVLNNMQLGGFINPYLYVMFLITLPVKIPNLLLLGIALATGLTVDMFQNTMGMHASACMLLAYLRPGWLKMIAPRDGYESDAAPSVKKSGFQWFIVYAGVLVLVHHLLLFYLEVFRFSEFFSTFIRVLLSSVVTLLLIIIAQYLMNKPSDRALN
ncbi:rod shape-determining protein MreD [soil metagenome]